MMKKHGKVTKIPQNRFRELSDEIKNKKREYGRYPYRNITEESKQKLKEYTKN